MTTSRRSKSWQSQLIALWHETPSNISTLFSWVKGRRHQAIALSLGIPLALGIALLSSPVDALEASVTPANPKLGDTLSVIIRPNSPNATPTVTMGGKTYSAFLVGSDYRALLPTTPLESPGIRQIQVESEGEQQTLTVRLANRSFPVQRIRLSGGGIEPTQQELNRVNAFKQLVTPEKFWNGPFIAPNGGRISSIYGVRRYYNGVFAKDYYHRGVDYAGGHGSPVIAPAAGRVALVGRVSEGFRLHGNTIGIDHGQGVTSIFLHLSRIDVREGDFVRAGQAIGAIGSTGASTGPHLHWGLYVNGQSVDPVPWRTKGIE